MTTAREKAALHRMLEQNYQGHKMEVFDYCGGHLNEGHLWKPPLHIDAKSWESALKPAVSSMTGPYDAPPSELANKKKEEEARVQEMETAISDFTMGLQATVPGRSVAMETRKDSPRRTPRRLNRVLTGDHKVVDKDLYVGSPRKPGLGILPTPPASGRVRPSSLRDSRILVEEYPVTKSFLPSPRGLQQSGLKEGASDMLKDGPGGLHLLEATRAGQYRRMKQFREGVVREQDTRETGMLTGTKAVEHLEMTLRKALSEMGHAGHGPNFHRLQVYSTAFDNLIKESPLFGQLLHEVKNEYDRYVSHLLDLPPPQHRLLAGQLTQIVDSGISQPGAVDAERQRLTRLEEEVARILENRRKLEEELAVEERLLQTAKVPRGPAVPRATITQSTLEERPLTEAEQLEELKAVCWQRLDAIAKARERMRTKCTPSAICAHLELCCQDTEIELQKLVKKRDCTEENVETLETELRQLLEGCDISQRDEKKLWRIIGVTCNQGERPSEERLGSVTKSPAHDTSSSPLVNQPDPVLAMEDDEDEDEDTRWNWYIS